MRIGSSRSPLLLSVIAAALLLRLLTLGLYPLMDTTEARYAEIARKMVELGDWITPWFDYGVPFWGKPPLSFWLTATSFKLFGASEFAARLPHWASGVAVAALVWGLAARRSRREATYAVALLVGSVLYFIATGAVMTDMALAFGTTLAMRGFWAGRQGTAEDRGERSLLFLGVAIGLLAKGPIAVALVALPILAWTFATRSFAAVVRGIPWLWGGLIVLAVALPWYVLAESRTPGFLRYFLVGEHWERFLTAGWKGDLYGSAHDYPRGAIWLFAWADLLPWSLLLPLVFMHWRKQPAPEQDPAERRWRLYLLLWALAPCVFFTAAGNILWTYALPGLPALALWTSAWLSRFPEARVNRLLISGLIFTLLGTSVFIVHLVLSGWAQDKSTKALVADYYARQVGDEPLVFLGKRPHSATFYSRGTATLVLDPLALARRLERGPAFVAVPREAAAALPPALRRRLRPLSQRGAYLLFVADRQARGAAGAADGRVEAHLTAVPRWDCRTAASRRTAC